MVSEGYSPSRLHVIHNSLSHAVQLQIRRKLNPTSIYRKHFGNALPVLIFIGRLTPSKKLDMILDAMRILQDRHFLCNLVLVGSGPAEVSLRQTAASLGLQERVWLYGPSYNENVNAELIWQNILFLASNLPRVREIFFIDLSGRKMNIISELATSSSKVR